MKKHKILGIVLIASLLLFSVANKVSAESNSNDYTIATIEVLNEPEGESISEPEIESSTDEEPSQESSEENDDEETEKEPKNHGKAIMVYMLIGIPGILFLALGVYSIVMGFKNKRKDYLLYGPQLLASHCAFALTCGIQGFGTNYMFVPLAFTILAFVLSIIGLKDVHIDLNAQVASKKNSKKPFVKIVCTLVAIIALAIAFGLKTSRDKTLDSEFVAAFFLAISVLVNAFDAGKSLSKFLGSSNL